jgi:hypothetical protein
VNALGERTFVRREGLLDGRVLVLHHLNRLLKLAVLEANEERCEDTERTRLTLVLERDEDRVDSDRTHVRIIKKNIERARLTDGTELCVALREHRIRAREIVRRRKIDRGMRR